MSTSWLRVPRRLGNFNNKAASSTCAVRCWLQSGLRRGDELFPGCDSNSIGSHHRSNLRKEGGFRNTITLIAYSDHHLAFAISLQFTRFCYHNASEAKPGRMGSTSHSLSLLRLQRPKTPGLRATGVQTHGPIINWTRQPDLKLSINGQWRQ